MEYLKLLNKLNKKAVQYIRERITREKIYVLFQPTEEGEDENEDWNVDIYDGIPDFPHYAHMNMTEWAAFKEISLNEDNQIQVVGILKGQSYPQKVTVVLDELPAQAVLDLADYMTKH